MVIGGGSIRADPLPLRGFEPFQQKIADRLEATRQAEAGRRFKYPASGG